MHLATNDKPADKISMKHLTEMGGNTENTTYLMFRLFCLLPTPLKTLRALLPLEQLWNGVAASFNSFLLTPFKKSSSTNDTSPTTSLYFATVMPYQQPQTGIQVHS
jgi:hypothetical protein